MKNVHLWLITSKIANLLKKICFFESFIELSRIVPKRSNANPLDSLWKLKMGGPLMKVFWKTVVQCQKVPICYFLALLMFVVSGPRWNDPCMESGYNLDWPNWSTKRWKNWKKSEAFSMIIDKKDNYLPARIVQKRQLKTCIVHCEYRDRKVDCFNLSYLTT